MLAGISNIRCCPERSGMPYRKTLLHNGDVYHTFNRSIERQPIFTSSRECSRALKAVEYYRYANPPIRLSHFLSQTHNSKNHTLRTLKYSPVLVSILSYCFMPNHFHFLLRQEAENGISIFIGRFQNSFVRYFNDYHHRRGPLFESAFRTVKVESERQLLHTSRYIHLNPFTSGIVRHQEDICDFKWSSMSSMVHRQDDGPLVDSGSILSSFETTQSYREFVLDNADYQKSLHNNQKLFIDVDS